VRYRSDASLHHRSNASTVRLNSSKLTICASQAIEITRLSCICARRPSPQRQPLPFSPNVSLHCPKSPSTNPKPSARPSHPADPCKNTTSRLSTHLTTTNSGELSKRLPAAPEIGRVHEAVLRFSRWTDRPAASRSAVKLATKAPEPPPIDEASDQ